MSAAQAGLVSTAQSLVLQVCSAPTVGQSVPASEETVTTRREPAAAPGVGLEISVTLPALQAGLGRTVPTIATV